MKNATITARINSELKEQAEDILKKIGLSSSTAIGLFYNSIVINKGIPFQLRLGTIKSELRFIEHKEDKEEAEEFEYC